VHAFRLSLTLRLALLYAASTFVVVLAVAAYMIHVLDAHFAEQDAEELRGKLELSGRLLAQAHTEGALAALPARLDDALVGHHHLSLAVFRDSTRWYASGTAIMPPALLAAAAADARSARLVEWRADTMHYRGLALAAAAPTATVIAVAVDIEHHREFLAAFRLALAGVVAVAGLAAALLGWAVARAGLAPVRQMAGHAGSITAARLTERLAADAAPAELRELATSFNAMLDRLHDSFRRLTEFSADLAHEMRTPVSNLMTQTQVTLAQARSAEEYREVLASNLEEYERLARMIADMLFLAKADRGLVVPTREPVDLAAEIRGLFEFYEALAEERGVRLASDGSAVVAGDRLMLRRALSNLLSNAIRHTARGGTVRVAVALAVAPAPTFPGVVVAVENPGEPIPPGQLERLFDRFYRAEPARRASAAEKGDGEGSGLGLAIARSIALAHGGTLSAAATADGNRFELHLPGA
jgi:two-component system heavy metal sensor histidine kinase CusS